MKKIEIFLIDELTVVCEGIRCLINNSKDFHVIEEAYNSEDALQKIKLCKCDVIVYDLFMDNGIEFLHLIRESCPDIPVLILSKYCEKSISVRLIRSGVAGCLCKTRSSGYLLDAIKKVYSGGKFITETVAQHLANQIDFDSSKSPLTLLSNREYQVLQKLSSGIDSKGVATELFLSPKTISTYKKRILEKLQCKNIAELTRYAIAENIS